MTTGHTRSSFSYFFFWVVVVRGKDTEERVVAFVCVCFFCVCACASRTGVLELLRVHAVSPADSEMDVRFFPAPPSSVGSCTLPADSGLDYYHPNKVTVLSTSLFDCLSVYISIYFTNLSLPSLCQSCGARATKSQAASEDAAATRCTFRYIWGGEPGAVNSAVFGSSSLENKHLLRARPCDNPV